MHVALLNSCATPAREAARYHLEAGGGRLRARLALASGLTWNTPPNHRIPIAAACELLHNASLIHDDLSDGDTRRRDHATVWQRYGRDIALCAGDLLLTCAFRLAADIEDAAASQAVARHLAAQTERVIGGQSRELAVRRDASAPAVAAYIDATRAKTAPLIELPLAVGAVPDRMPTSAARTLRQLAEAIGLAYQILDDLDDCTARSVGNLHEALHPLHAWQRHKPPGRASVPAARIAHRCQRHARAALARAQRLSAGLPAPLGPELRAIVAQLATKADQHAAAVSDWSGKA